MTHKNLVVWQKSIDLVEKIYNFTDNYPEEELYGLTSQMRRASVSIPSNIAEGYGRYSQKELVRFLFISLGSASELETQIIISKRIRFVNDETFEELNQLVLGIIKMLSNLIKSKNNGKLINPDDEPTTDNN